MGTWKSDDPARADSGPTVRGKTISNPIPFPDKEEYSFEGRPASVSPPHEREDNEKQLVEDRPASSEPIPSPTEYEKEDKDLPEENKSIESFSEIPPQPSYAPPVPPPQPVIEPISKPAAQPVAQPAAQPIASSSTVRISSPAIPSSSEAEKPRRRKSGLRSVFGKLFGGKKGRDNRPPTIPEESVLDTRAGQHRSVSSESSLT